MQGLTLAAIIASEKHALVLDDVTNARLVVKLKHNHSSTKSRSRAQGHIACLKSVLRTITMQGLTLVVITASENAR